MGDEGEDFDAIWAKIKALSKMDQARLRERAQAGERRSWIQEDAMYGLMMGDPAKLIELLSSLEPISGGVRQTLIELFKHQNEIGKTLVFQNSKGKGKGNKTNPARQLAALDRSRSIGVNVLKYMVAGNAYEYALEYAAKELGVSVGVAKAAYGVYMVYLRAMGLEEETIEEIKSTLDR